MGLSHRHKSGERGHKILEKYFSVGPLRGSLSPLRHFGLVRVKPN